MVKDGSDGDTTLDAIFDEINGAYATSNGGGFVLEKKDFTSRKELERYVKNKDYREQGLCFALGWDTYDPSTH